jgi:hypothetical protein
MVKTDKEWTWNAIKDLVKHLDLQVNDVKQMWAEIDTDEGAAEADRTLEEIYQAEYDYRKTMPGWLRGTMFENDDRGSQ